MTSTRNSRGFTILELCLALLCISVVATFSIWAYFSRAEVTLVNAAELLVNDLRLAQSRATIQHAPVEVVFHTDSTGYHMVAPDTQDLPSATAPRSYPRDAVFEGVRILTKHLPDRQRLVFSADGHVMKDASITLTFQGETRTVLVRVDGTIYLADGEAP